MGYFPNGSAGSSFEAQYCSKCVHENDEKGCPVMLAHILFAYKLCNEKQDEGKQILDLLIPEDAEGFNDQCAMFFDKTKVDPNANHPELPFQ